MRRPTGFGSTALVALFVVEVLSLVTIAVAAAAATLEAAVDEPTRAEPSDRTKRRHHALHSATLEPQRLAQ